MIFSNIQADQLEYAAPYFISIPGQIQESGTVHFWENQVLFPKGIQRCFWISGVKEGATRGNHAHWKEAQVLVAIAGTLWITILGIDETESVFELSEPGKGLFVPPLNWVEVRFSPDAVLLGLSDRAFEETDYIRDKDDFGNIQKGNR